MKVCDVYLVNPVVEPSLFDLDKTLKIDTYNLHNLREHIVRFINGASFRRFITNWCKAI